MLPSVAARDFDEDPTQFSAFCLMLIRYSEAKDAWDSNNPKTHSAWQGSRMFEQVKDNDFALAREEMGELGG